MNAAPLKLVVIVGTRPEIIRLSRVVSRLVASPQVDVRLVHTGQNYDHELNQIFFDEFELPAPDHYLDCDTTSLGRTYGDILAKSEQVLREVQPDAVLVLGDTNSAIAALMARRLGIAVFHMEAGNRSFDWKVPEETNRRIVDHISDLNLVYTEHARRNLLREGLHPQRIHLTGSPMREVLEFHQAGIDASDVHHRLGVAPNRYLLASLHREENVDNREVLGGLIAALRELHLTFDVPVIVTTHPRLRRRLDEFDVATESLHGLRFEAPFGFLDYNRLQRDALAVLSDSGTIGEESAILGFAAVTPREWIERPEALDAGSLVVSGTTPEAIVRSVSAAIEMGPPTEIPSEYEVRNCSERVLRLLVGRDRSLRRTQR